MSRAERRITIAVVVLPFAGFGAALWRMWGGLVTIRDIGILTVMYSLAGFGITIGFHRLLSHRSFDAPDWLRGTLAALGSMAAQGAVIHWVAHHRKHHAFADEHGDPHSPHTTGVPGWRGVVRGMWHAHMGWMFVSGQHASARRYAPDLRCDPTISLIDRQFLGWVVMGLATPFIAGYVLSGGNVGAGLTGLLWGGLARIFLFHHATWSVNSICHCYGKRPFQTRDQSRNNWAIAIVALGEGWHHNHHAFPTSARHGLLRGQLDPSHLVIRCLERLGLAYNVRRPTPNEISRKRREDSPRVAVPSTTSRPIGR
jgi:stearoyl-CoA desaturase (Delta-9 desaturase)